MYWLTGIIENGNTIIAEDRILKQIVKRLKALPENNSLSGIPKTDFTENSDYEDDRH